MKNNTLMWLTLMDVLMLDMVMMNILKLVDSVLSSVNMDYLIMCAIKHVMMKLLMRGICGDGTCTIICLVFMPIICNQYLHYFLSCYVIIPIRCIIITLHTRVTFVYARWYIIRTKSSNIWWIYCAKCPTF